MKKQGAMRSAPSEQCDYVSEGSKLRAHPVDDEASIMR